MTPLRRGRQVAFVAACGIVCGCLVTGCSGPPRRATESPRSAAASMPRASRQKLLAGATAVLERLDDFDEARGMELVFDRLVQWSRAAAPDLGAEWRPDPLTGSLPERVRDAAQSLETTQFEAGGDVMFLRDQRWLAAIARVARGDAVDDLAVAERLFRWTVRSLAIVSDPPLAPSESNPGTRWFLPGEILLAGRASPAQRAWIFLELLRHAGLPGVMLATAEGGDEPQPWLPALLTGGEAYLFDPAYGMPIPGPGGDGIATLRQAAADPAILAALALPDRPYRVEPREAAAARVLVAADPWTASRRMAAIDPDLRAADGLPVAVSPSAIAEAAVAALPPGAADGAPRLWEFPWQTATRRRSPAVSAAVARELAALNVVLMTAVGSEPPRPLRPLHAGRLREFRGEWDGPTGAKAAYLAARPSREVIAAAVRGLPPEQAGAAQALYGQMKEDAAYWLGVLTLAEGEWQAAVDYLGRMTLELAPDSRWADAARTNLAQAYVALGRREEAIALLESDRSPQRFGSRLAAARLAAGLAPAAK